MSEERPTGGVDQSDFLGLIGDLRPELHRYCARLTGSVIDGEDVVQDSLASAFVALKTLEAAPSLRAWVFRIAHNRALDLLRSRAIRAAEPLEGIVMSGWRPLIKGFFRRCVGRGCGHVFGLSRGELDPPALMLSADPLPRSRQRA